MRATRDTLTKWIERLRAEAAEISRRKLTAFRPNGRAWALRQALSRCGEAVQRIRYADNETNYLPSARQGPRCSPIGFVAAAGCGLARTLDELEAAEAPLTAAAARLVLPPRGPIVLLGTQGPGRTGRATGTKWQSAS